MPITPIRPPLTPPTPTAARTDGRQAAQRAFFALAAGKTPAAEAAAAPVQAARTPATAPTAQAKAPQAQAAAEPPTRILRPGSLLNIRV